MGLHFVPGRCAGYIKIQQGQVICNLLRNQKSPLKPLIQPIFRRRTLRPLRQEPAVGSDQPGHTRGCPRQDESRPIAAHFLSPKGARAGDDSPLSKWPGLGDRDSGDPKPPRQKSHPQVKNLRSSPRRKRRSDVPMTEAFHRLSKNSGMSRSKCERLVVQPEAPACHSSSS